MSNNVGITVFDMNKSCLEIEKVIDLNEVLKEELKLFLKNGKENLLLSKGLIPEKLILTVENTKRFTPYIISLVFPGYGIKNTENERCGHPDFILDNGKEKIYLEIKNNEDGLRKLQLGWFIENKEKINKVMWIETSLQNYSLSSKGV